MSTPSAAITANPALTQAEADQLQRALSAARADAQAGHQGYRFDGRQMESRTVYLADDHPLWNELTVAEAKLRQWTAGEAVDFDFNETMLFERGLRELAEAGEDTQDAQALVETLRKRSHELERAALAQAGAREFGMFSVEGNRRVTELVDSLAPATDAEYMLTPQAAMKRLQAGLDAIRAAGHTEVGDTDVREQVAAELVANGALTSLSIFDF